MKNKVVKLDKRQVRSLIKEAIEGRQPGSPLWTPPVEKKPTVETLGAGIAGRRPIDAIDNLCMVVGNSWHDLAGADDPSIELTGVEAWEYQVDEASEELYNEVQNLIYKIENKLIEGEYYRKA
jgi:hypothetical protein